MGRLWNKWLVPALFAVILFLCIRVANDIPKHEYYWESNEWNFMLKDINSRFLWFEQPFGEREWQDSGESMESGWLVWTGT